MSALDLAETALTAGTPLGWARGAGIALKTAWKALPWVASAGLTIALLITRGELDHIRMQGHLDTAKVELAGAREDLVQADRYSTAIQSYADRRNAQQPLIVRSTNTVTRYAETPAGRALCAAPDRVLGIDQLDQALFPRQGAAGSSAGTVSPDAGAPAGGRVGDQR